MGFFSLAVAVLCFIAAVFLLTPPGRPLQSWMADSLTFRQGLWSIVFINGAAASYLAFFIYKLNSPDRIWLINVFISWTMMIAGTGQTALSLRVDIPISESAQVIFGGDTISNIAIAFIGYLLHTYSAPKYKQSQASKK